MNFRARSTDVRAARAALASGVDGAAAARDCLKRLEAHLTTARVERTASIESAEAHRQVTAAQRDAHEEELAVVAEELRRIADSDAPPPPNDARDDALAMVSHDLRGMLGTVDAALSLLRATVSSPSASAPYCNSIERTTSRMLSLVNDLVDASTIDAGTMSVHLAPQRTRALIAAALEAFRPTAAKKCIELVSACDDVSFLADPLRIDQVIGNLVGNALKFTPKGGVVAISARAARDGGVELAVADNGPGIPPDELPFVFSKFWKGASGSREGAGLGLHITQMLVGLQGGSITVESQVGRGTTFRVHFPPMP